jgi:hypothetical protein
MLPLCISSWMKSDDVQTISVSMINCTPSTPTPYSGNPSTGVRMQIIHWILGFYSAVGVHIVCFMVLG